MRAYVLVAAALTGVYGCGCAVSVDPIVEARRKPILAAAIDCDMDLLRRCFVLSGLGASASARMKSACTPIHYGARHAAAAAFLIDDGADVNASADDGSTPLMSAHAPVFISDGEETAEAVRFLIAKGAQVQATNKFAQTPLMSAAMDGDPGALRALNQAGF